MNMTNSIEEGKSDYREVKELDHIVIETGLRKWISKDVAFEMTV